MPPNKSNFISCNSDNFFLPLPVPSAYFHCLLYPIHPPPLIYSSCLVLCHFKPLCSSVRPSVLMYQFKNPWRCVYYIWHRTLFGQVVEQFQVALSSDSSHNEVTDRLVVLLHVWKFECISGVGLPARAMRNKETNIRSLLAPRALPWCHIHVQPLFAPRSIYVRCLLCKTVTANDVNLTATRVAVELLGSLYVQYTCITVWHV